MKIRPVGVKLYHADGRTDMKKLTVAFRTSAEAPNKNDSLSENSFECFMFVTWSSCSMFHCFVLCS